MWVEVSQALMIPWKTYSTKETSMSNWEIFLEDMLL